MAILTFLLGLLAFVGGLGALAMSVNLVPTEMGQLYAVSGVIFLSAAAIVWAIAAMIRRLDQIVAPRPKPKTEEIDAPPAPEPAAPVDDGEVNVNRRGHLPTLHEMEEALIEPEAPPQVIGRYAAGGAKYVVFSDGAIEAETADGDLRFASMTEFKAYIAARKS